MTDRNIPKPVEPKDAGSSTPRTEPYSYPEDYSMEGQPNHPQVPEPPKTEGEAAKDHATDGEVEPSAPKKSTKRK